MDLLSFGKTGWGDELFYATLMTIAVAVTAMLIGFLFSLIFTPLKLSNNKLITSPWECKVHEKISGALVFGNTSIGGCIFPTCRDIWRTTIMFDVGNLEICFHDKEYLEDFLRYK